MVIILSILLTLSFVGYNLVLFSYCVYIFNLNKKPIVEGVICGLINFAFWVLFIVFVPIQYEYIAMILYTIILAIESKLVLKIKFIEMMFISITFTINLFAKRMVILAVIALLNGANIINAVNSFELTTIVAVISFTVSISTINFARKSIPRNSLDTILADNKNLTFLTIAFSILFVTLAIFIQTINADIQGNNLLYHYIVLGCISIAAFAVFILFAHNLAELRITTETYKRLRQENTENLEKLKDLEQEAIKDDLTGLYTRDYADRKVKELVEKNISVFVAFVDLDGLKIVNDDFGHEEGDFYIRRVAEILKDYFRGSTVCRYGGDEMLVVGQFTTEEEVTKKLIWCYRAVININERYSKEYRTSISYGVAYKHLHENISPYNLISIADSRMYDLKKSNKKHRKVTSLVK